jgi:transposase
MARNTECYGKCEAVYAQFRKWQNGGLFEPIFQALRADADMEILNIDSICPMAVGSFPKRIFREAMCWVTRLIAQRRRDFITEQGATYDIPPQSSVKEPWDYDKHTYKERYIVVHFFQKLKWLRCVATRYDKSDASFLTFVLVAAIAILL